VFFLDSNQEKVFSSLMENEMKQIPSKLECGLFILSLILFSLKIDLSFAFTITLHFMYHIYIL
jgi:hypothetical protein